MRTPAGAIAWEFWGRARLGIAAIAAAVVGLSFAGILLPSGVAREPIFPLSVILFALAAVYVASKVMHCEYRDGRLESGYPARMWTLPVRSRTLVVWPMISGAGALAVLWCALVLLVWLPVGVEPAWWLLPLLVVALAWLQAIFWAVPGSTLAKIIAACAAFPALKAMLELVATLVALAVDPHSRLDRAAFIEHRVLIISLFSVCFLPLAYAVALVGVALDRRGARFEGVWIAKLIDALRCHLPRWRTPSATRPAWAAVRAIQRFLLERCIHTASAERAQFWIEFRCHGLILPLFPICFLLFVAVVVVPFVNSHQLLTLLAMFSGAVPVLGFFAGYGLGKSGFWVDDLGLSTWQATRPLSSAALANAKLRTAAASALLTGGVVWVGIPIWLVTLGRLDGILEVCQPYLRQHSIAAVWSLASVGFCGFWALTWGKMVGGLVLSLTGRTWIVNIGFAVYLLLLTALSVTARWMAKHSSGLEAFWPVLTCCCIAAVGMKVVAAAVMVYILHHRKLLNPIHVGITIICWILGVACLVTLVLWQIPAQGLPLFNSAGRSGHLPTTLIALASLLALPLVRPIAAPLAVAWNRHR